MAIMEKRVVLGVERTKVPSKRRKKMNKRKHFLRRLVDYLKSDSYLFAPLVTRSLKNFEFKEETKRESEDKLVKRVIDYLMSDSYMYASLVLPRPKYFHVPPKESRPQIKRVTRVEISRSITWKDENRFAINEIAKSGREAENDLPEKAMKDQRSRFAKETEKREIYEKYRLSPVPERMFGSKIRNLY